MVSSVQPPGPRGNRFFGSLVARSRRDPLNFLTGVAQKYGDVSSFRVGFERIFLINHPDYIREVLLNHYDGFLKGTGRRRVKKFLGEGIFLSEGDLHRRQRRLAVPAFHRQRLAGYALTMGDYSARAAARWQRGQPLDIFQEMRRLTLAIVGQTLFGTDIESEANEVGEAMKQAMKQ